MDDLNELGDLGIADDSRAISNVNDANVMGEIPMAPNAERWIHESHTEEWIHSLGNFSEDDISALSKAYSLTKMIACFQALWFVTQVISRVVEDRAVTLLEELVLAFVSLRVAHMFWSSSCRCLENFATIPD